MGSTLDCVLGLLSASHAEEPTDDSRFRTHACGGVGEDGNNSDGGSLDPDARWTLAHAPSLHPTGEGCPSHVEQVGHHLAVPTATANQIL